MRVFRGWTLRWVCDVTPEAGNGLNEVRTLGQEC